MSQRFKPNIDRKGRIARASWGGLCVVLGLVAGTKVNWLAGGGLIGLGIFAFFEAGKAWCILRACGIKTKY